MEQIITLKVDLEHPNEAHHAINKAVEAYEKSKNRCQKQSTGHFVQPVQ